MKKLLTFIFIFTSSFFAINIARANNSDDALGLLKINDEEYIEVLDFSVLVDTNFTEIRYKLPTGQEQTYVLGDNDTFRLDAATSRTAIDINEERLLLNAPVINGIADLTGLEIRIIYYKSVDEPNEQEMYHLTYSDTLNVVRTASSNLIHIDLLDGNGPIAYVTTGNEKYDIFYPEKDGFFFDGWFLDEQLTQALEYPFTITADLVIYPKFAALSEETVTINFINSSEQTPNYTPLEVNKGAVVDLDYFRPYKMDKEFLGWFLDEALTIELLDTHAFEVDTTIYAAYEDVYHRVKFYSNDNLFSNIRVKINDKVSRPVIDPNLTGYEFLGWYLNQKEFDFETPITSDLEIHAKFKRVNTVLISLVTNRDNYEVLNLTFEADEVGNELELPALGWSETWKFGGWFLDEDLTTEAPNTIPDADATYYAKWNRLEKITITFETNGGLHIDALEHVVPTTLMAEILPTPVRAGYVFKGWYENQTLTKPVSEEALIDVTLYAKWEEEIEDEEPIIDDNNDNNDDIVVEPEEKSWFAENPIFTIIIVIIGGLSILYFIIND